MGFIYLIQLAKHKNINVYKVGMTEQLKLKDRLNGYGKLGIDYVVEYFMKVNGSKNIEEKILEIFNEHFILYEGREWFMGNSKEMIDIIKDVENDKTNDGYKLDYDKWIQYKKYQSIKDEYNDYFYKNMDKPTWVTFDCHDRDWEKEMLECLTDTLDGPECCDFINYCEREWSIDTDALKLKLKLFDKFIENI